jgi:ribose transport system ATP-binding protein
MLSIRGLSKRFGGTRALVSVDLDAGAGEVLAVIGENGAGKSTLMKVLAGAIAPDLGSIYLDGRRHCPEHPAAARGAGVALVPQEPELVAQLSVAENILLGSEPTRCGIVDGARLRERAARSLAYVTTDDDRIELHQLAGELRPSQRQRVVVARALSQPHLRLLIFDEPTSSLTRVDVQRLFLVITRLKQRGLAILYVSHFLEEVLAIADRYTVLRDGRVVGSGNIAQTSASDLVTLMAGTQVTARSARPARPPGEVVLDIQHLSGETLPSDVSFQLHAGEVLGIAGLVGSGRTELLRAIFGLQSMRCGSLRIRNAAGPFSPEQCLNLGLGLLSEDRRAEGLAQGLTIAQNATLSKLPKHGPFVTAKAQRKVSIPLIFRLGIRCRNADQNVSELSGGNQQKVALARLLHHDVEILLLDEPTRGIDVRSRGDVHRCIDELVSQGKAILLVSSYLPELLVLCDRIAVICRGTLGQPRPARDWDEHSLLLAATGTA